MGGVSASSCSRSGSLSFCLVFLSVFGGQRAGFANPSRFQVLWLATPTHLPGLRNNLSIKVMGVGNDWAPFSQNPLADGRKSTLYFFLVLHVKRVRPTHAGRVIPSAHCASHANQTGFHGLSEDAGKTMPTLQTCQIIPRHERGVN